MHYCCMIYYFLGGVLLISHTLSVVQWYMIEKKGTYVSDCHLYKQILHLYMPNGLNQSNHNVSHTRTVSGVLLNLVFFPELDGLMSWRQAYASECNDLFISWKTHLTVNIVPVSSIPRELCDIQPDSENIKWSNASNTSQYWWSSLLYVHIMIKMAKDTGCPRNIRCCYSLQNCTLWYRWGSLGVENNSSAHQDQLKL